jgi:hypothetical protein
MATSWFRSAGAGQKTSSMVRVLGAPELEDVPLLLLLPLDVLLLVDEPFELEKYRKAPAATTIRTIMIATATTRPIADLRLVKNCKAWPRILGELYLNICKPRTANSLAAESRSSSLIGI